MKRIVLTIGLAAVLSLCSGAQQSSSAARTDPTPFPAGWTGKEFNALPPMIQETEDFINKECRPSTLDNIQIMNMQHGHGQPINIHVYCRQDNSATSHYKLSLVPVIKRRLPEALYPVLDRPNTRVVGFYFGEEGKEDGIMLLEKTK